MESKMNRTGFRTNFGDTSHAVVGRCTNRWQRACAVFLVLAAAAIAASAQTFTVVTDFDGDHGANPGVLGDMTLVQGLDGNLYGTTFNGGATGHGVVFKVAGGILNALHSFADTAAEGGYPVGGLVLATNGNFYGTTSVGGTDSDGTVYRISSHGVLKTLHSFNGIAGQDPWDHLIQGTDGKFWGTTTSGGSVGDGTAFKMTAAGVLATVHNFAGGAGDGFLPVDALVQGTDGNFYGTTVQGGVNSGAGIIFKMTPAGAVNVLHSFDSGGDPSDGYQPRGGLVEGLDGNLYGTATGGGSPGGGPGTIFRITPSGTFTKLYSFAGYPGDGASPYDGLTLGSDGNFYGTTLNGGSAAAACNCGTIFQITPGGTYKMLYSFTGKADGRVPFNGLMQGTDGNFYGATTAGGNTTNAKCVYDATQTCGTVFSLSMGLGPFVSALPASGKAGKAVKILGNSLTGATAVNFNGTAAAFHVVSSTEITTKVPAGATTGYVTVTTPSGMLSSNIPFRVP